jgi:hypothetical protein
MLVVLWALAAGLGLGALGFRDRRPLSRRIAVALVGSYAGALLGGLAGSLLVSVAALSLVETGIVIGSLGGALAAPFADRRLERALEPIGGSHD